MAEALQWDRISMIHVPTCGYSLICEEPCMNSQWTQKLLLYRTEASHMDTERKSSILAIIPSLISVTTNRRASDRCPCRVIALPEWTAWQALWWKVRYVLGLYERPDTAVVWLIRAGPKVDLASDSTAYGPPTDHLMQMVHKTARATGKLGCFSLVGWLSRNLGGQGFITSPGYEVVFTKKRVDIMCAFFGRTFPPILLVWFIFCTAGCI